MEQPYSDKVMDHFLHPRNVGELPDANGIGNVGNPICGDVMRMYIKVENNVIVNATFKTFGCLPPDEKIVSSRGGWEKVSGVYKGLTVINSDGNSTCAVELYQRDYAGPLLTIVPFVSPFNSFRITPGHPVLAIKRSSIKDTRSSGSKSKWLRVEKKTLSLTTPDFIRAGELKTGDYLIFNVNHKIRDNDLFTKDLMRLIGYYLSEGYTAARGSTVAFAFNKNEKNLIDEIQILIRRTTGKQPKLRIRGSVAEVYVCSRKLTKFLLQHCKKIARNKSLSEDILLLPFSKQWEMLQTYMYGDGDHYKRRPHNSQTYRIVTTSESLAIQTQEILARGGIFSSIRQVFKTNCYIGDRKLKDSTQYLISFKLDRKHKFVQYANGYFLVPIRQIHKENFKGTVHNFQVADEPNSYLVRGFAVHNCGAAIATSSMVTEMVKGKTIDEALNISNKAVAEALGGLPAIKMHCSVLAEEALKSAIEDYRKRQEVKSDVK